MQPKLIMTPLGQYEPAKWDGENTSGVDPINRRIVILPDTAAGQTSGKVYITEEMQERMAMAAETGVLVAVAVDAWTRSADRTGPYTGRKPKVGERIMFERYAGQIHHGSDGRIYRAMDCDCVGGIVDQGALVKPKVEKVTRPPLIPARGA
jgi:co-chaperonin GroES (HSP10)